ncbi:MAG: translation initiation factor IF-3 [Parcubacteria group bacterium]
MRRRFSKRPQRVYKYKPRANNQIRVSEVQVIDAEGNQLGTMKTSDAIKLALEAELDLVEISPTTNPPVTRITDYGKFLYEKEKKERSSKAGRSSQEVKTVRITFRAGEHDLKIRANQADKFLGKGHRTRIELKLRGRERAPGMKSLVKSKVDTFLTLLEFPFSIESPMKQSPAGTVILLKPEKKEKNKGESREQPKEQEK